MGLGTIGNGKVKCAWCGQYLKNADDGILGAVGFGIVSRVANAAVPQYCSKQCKLAAQNAKGGGSGDSGHSGGGGIWNSTDAEVQARKETEQAERTEKEEIQNMRFDGTGDDIAADLNKLVTKYIAIPTGLAAPVDAKNQKAAIIEKMEFGIMKLRKVDSDSADFFQKKMDGLTVKKGLFGKK